MSQADSYFLYSYAVRDAKALFDKTVPDMVVRINGNVTVYEFMDHVIRECGTHLTGTVTVTPVFPISPVEDPPRAMLGTFFSQEFEENREIIKLVFGKPPHPDFGATLLGAR